MKEKDYRVEYLKEREARESLEKFIEDFYIRFCDLYHKFSPMGSVKDRIHNSGWQTGVHCGWNSGALFVFEQVKLYVDKDTYDKMIKDIHLTNVAFEENFEDLKRCDKCKGNGYLEK